jgi:hypothetical protein
MVVSKAHELAGLGLRPSMVRHIDVDPASILATRGDVDPPHVMLGDFESPWPHVSMTHSYIMGF